MEADHVHVAPEELPQLVLDVDQCEQAGNFQVYAHVHVAAFRLLAAGYGSEEADAGYAVEESALLLVFFQQLQVFLGGFHNDELLSGDIVAKKIFQRL